MTPPLNGPETHYHGQYACDKNHDPDPDEKLDPVRLAIERDEAWELMRHYERKKDYAEDRLVHEVRHRQQCQVKSRAFDRLRSMMINGRIENKEAERIIEAAYDSWKQLVEADAKKAAK